MGQLHYIHIALNQLKSVDEPIDAYLTIDEMKGLKDEIPDIPSVRENITIEHFRDMYRFNVTLIGIKTKQFYLYTLERSAGKDEIEGFQQQVCVL